MTMVATIAVVILVASEATATVVYAQNTTTIQAINYSNTTIPSIKGLNTNIIIDAINAEIRSVYDGNGEKSTNSVNISNKQ